MPGRGERVLPDNSGWGAECINHPGGHSAKEWSAAPHDRRA
jgi:hypothetical protein